MQDDVHAKIHHHRHPEVITRLKRAEGHLRSTIEMVVNVRSCLDIAQQLQAVEGAIANARKILIQEHIDHCLEHTVEALAIGERASLEDFKQITKYL